MSIEKIVSRLTVTAEAIKPPWLAKATAILKNSGKFTLTKADTYEEDFDDDNEDEGAEGEPESAQYAVFTSTDSYGLTLSAAHLPDLSLFTKKNKLAVKIVIHKGKLVVVFNDNFNIHTIADILS